MCKSVANASRSNSNVSGTGLCVNANVIGAVAVAVAVSGSGSPAYSEAEESTGSGTIGSSNSSVASMDEQESRMTDFVDEQERLRFSAPLFAPFSNLMNHSCGQQRIPPSFKMSLSFILN